MYAKTAIAITSLLAAAEAVKVTKPAKGDEWDLSKTNEITWDSVNTDPSSFEIVIVNQSSYPPVEVKIGKVNTADGKYELKDAKVSAGDNYRINFVSTDPQNSGILAQSEQFDLTGTSSDDDKTTSASATASATGASTSGSASASASATGASTSGTATVTATASGLTTVTTGTATASASGTASDASGSASGTATGTSTTAPSSASAIKSTFAIFGSIAVAAYMLF
ncbi:extracellular conserved serine-rich protein [Colletotrichum sojae]|uniref:Extracellular conserved serine-rich protein n=1 Tax=Colletotrichum sojae TaxID=2175907 RepID=A0A8H6MKS1_9PEZI|nr:extracellular conserved serine-rich protein [Colletotrichum sojae]